MFAQIKVPKVRTTTAPKQFEAHPLVRGRYFYTLPGNLLELVQKGVGIARFDSDLLRVERALSECAGDHGYTVGFLNGAPINYHLLEERRPLQITTEQARLIGLQDSDSVREEFVSLANDRLDSLRKWAPAYVGWLMADSQFVQEHDGLIKKHRRQFQQHGFPRPRLASAPNESKSIRRRTAREGEWTREFRDFCARWRLQTLVGPGLPLPWAPQIPQLIGERTGFSAAEGGASVFVPDVFPLSGRGELREWVEDAVHTEDGTDHLGEWMKIAASSNPAKNAIPRFARLFRLQHYARVLYSRHADALNRKKTAIQEALSKFFVASQDAIKRDWKSLAGKLGPDWHLRPRPLP